MFEIFLLLVVIIGIKLLFMDPPKLRNRLRDSITNGYLKVEEIYEDDHMVPLSSLCYSDKCDASDRAKLQRIIKHLRLLEDHPLFGVQKISNPLSQPSLRNEHELLNKFRTDIESALYNVEVLIRCSRMQGHRFAYYLNGTPEERAKHTRSLLEECLDHVHTNLPEFDKRRIIDEVLNAGGVERFRQLIKHYPSTELGQ